MITRPRYIPASRRSNLSKYQYRGEDHSIISRYVLTPYWNRLVTFFPMNMAPNLMTLLGLFFVLVNFITLLVFVPHLSCSANPIHANRSTTWDSFFGAKNQNDSLLERLKSFVGLQTITRCPGGWLYLTFALGLWAYQSLDAIDGKQARRTGTAGPLGELFDHGCDALNTTFECMLASASLNLGFSWWTVASQVASLANFYLTTWEEYHTGTLYLSSFSGPVEGILIVITVFLITSMYGPTFWDQGVLSFLGLESFGLIKALHLKDLPLNQCSLLFGVISLASNTIRSYLNVVKARTSQKGPNAYTLLGLLPFAAQTTLNLSWLYFQPTLLTRHLTAFMVFYGLSFAYLVGLLIVSHVLKAPELFPYWNIMLIWSGVGLLDSILPMISFGHFKTPILQSTEARTVIFIRLSVFVAAVVYAYFVTDVILDVCDYFDINCLTIKRSSGSTSAKPIKNDVTKPKNTTTIKEKVTTIRKRLQD